MKPKDGNTSSRRFSHSPQYALRSTSNDSSVTTDFSMITKDKENLTSSITSKHIESPALQNSATKRYVKSFIFASHFCFCLFSFSSVYSNRRRKSRSSLSRRVSFQLNSNTVHVFDKNSPEVERRQKKKKKKTPNFQTKVNFLLKKSLN
jgi:hypothetical protein